MANKRMLAQRANVIFDFRLLAWLTAGQVARKFRQRES
jgi:hypothetical protein